MIIVNLNDMNNDFFAEIPKSITTMDADTLFVSYELLSGMMAEALVVIDFKKRNFRYVPNHDLFLCGYARETPKQLGYDFFKEVIYPKDLPSWIEIHDAIEDGLNNNELPAYNNINYCSFRLRVKSSLSSKKNPGYLTIYVKLKPIWSNGQLHYGVCLLSASVIQKPDRQLHVHYNDMDQAEYSFKTRKWTFHPFHPLSKRQKEMLVWSHQGYYVKEIAEKMCVSNNTIESIRQTLYEKFGVNSIEQALKYALNRRLIYHTPSILSETARVMNLPILRNKLSANDIQEIQSDLNQGVAVNAIAKKRKIPESTIRKAIQRGELKKNSP